MLGNAQLGTNAAAMGHVPVCTGCRTAQDQLRAIRRDGREREGRIPEHRRRISRLPRTSIRTGAH